MFSEKEVQIILGMVVVTLIPRVLPVFLEHFSFIKKLKSYFEVVPYCILTCLIFPTMVYTTESGFNPQGIIGGAAAIITALIGLPIIAVFILSVGTYMVSGYFI